MKREKTVHTEYKKSLGQNFLHDPKILEKIALAADIQKNDTVLEIGPGEGSLTFFLLERAKRVVAIEKDTELVLKLQEKFEKEIALKKLEIIQGDILEFSPREFFGDLNQTYVLVGNIPYYITGAIFEKFLEKEMPPTSLTFVIQKEVALRILGEDQKNQKNKKESILSLSVKVYGEPEYGGLIRAGSFYPSPKVNSAILSVRNITKKRFEENGVKEKVFFDFVKTGFAHKRKRLISNLGLLENFNREGAEEKFESLGLSKDIRSEDLSLDQWFAIIKACHQER